MRVGSSPIAPTTLCGRVVMVAEMVLEAIAYAWGFESLRPHQSGRMAEWPIAEVY